MPDLAKTQAEWTAFFREFTQYLRLQKIFDRFNRRFFGTSIRVLELNEGAGVVSEWTFEGVKRGVNSGEGGRLFVNLNDETPGAGQAQIQVYSDSAKTALVAQGDAADGATVTLAEQNNSGVTGTAKLGTVAASDTDIVLLTDIDEELKAVDTFGLSDGSRAAFRAFLTRINSVTTSLEGVRSALRGDIERNFLRTRMAEFLGSGTTAAISGTEEVDDNGDVQVTFTGLLFELADAMADNTPTAQTIEQNVVAVAAAVFDGDNAGKGAVVNVSDREYAKIGTITFTCTAGKATTLQELFSASLLDKNNVPVEAALSLQVKKVWESLDLGIRLRLDRTIIDTEVVGPNQTDTWVINGEALTNTDVGKLYANLEAGSFPGGGNRRVQLFSNSARTTLVAEGERTGDGTITLAAAGGSGLSGSVVIAYTADDTGIVVDLQPFAEGDIFTVDVTNDEAGVLQTLIKDLWGFDLPSAVPASATIPDLMLKEAADHISDVS